MDGILVAFNPRKPAPGEKVKITLVIRHPMDHGLGEVTFGFGFANYIYLLKLTLDGEPLAQFTLEGSVSGDPLLSLNIIAPEKSSELGIHFKDHDGLNVTESVMLEVNA